jgi:hypothetical protein
MPKNFDDRLSIQLIAECDSEPISTKTSHVVTLDNHTGQALYDVTFAVRIVHWRPNISRLNISRAGVPAPGGGSLLHNSGSLPPGLSVKETFDLTPQGQAIRRTETIDTTGDWTLSANFPVTGLPPRRASRSCSYTVTVE